jgi:hypothetical protein
MTNAEREATEALRERLQEGFSGFVLVTFHAGDAFHVCARASTDGEEELMNELLDVLEDAGDVIVLN